MTDDLRELKAGAAAVDPEDYNALIDAVVAGNGGSQPISMTSVQVSAADLLSLDDTPKVLLAAPAGRLYHIIHGIVVHYRYGTVAYAGNFTPAFAFGATVADYTAAGLAFDGPGIAFQPQPYNGADGQTLDMTALTEDAYFYVVGPSMLQLNAGPWTMWKASQIEGKAFSMLNLNDDASPSVLTLGDGTLTVRVWYTTIDGAP